MRSLILRLFYFVIFVIMSFFAFHAILAANSIIPTQFRLPRNVVGALAPALALLVWIAGARIADWNLDRRLRAIGMRRWRRWQFAWPLIPSFVLRKEAARLEDQSLLGAWHLPEHTRAAKAVISEELAKRGYSSQQTVDWLPPPSQTHVPPSVGFAMPIERYRAMVRSRSLLTGPFRWLALLLLVLVVPYTAIYPSTETSNPANVTSVSSAPRILPAGAPRTGASSQATSSPPKETLSPDSPLNPARLPPHLRWIGRSLEAVLGIVYPAACLGFFLIAGVATWHQRHRALRLLLLRPFGTARITKAAKRLVLRHLGPYGYVYTLEDRNYKPNWFVRSVLALETWFTLVWSALLKQPTLLATISAERQYVKLALALTRLWRPSFASFLNGGQAFTTRSTDAWWQMVINLFINSSDIVFIDVSHVGQGTAWEINQLEARRCFDKCMFVVHIGYEDEARAVFGKLLAATRVPQLFVYDHRGEFVERVAFDAGLAEHMNAALAAWGNPAARETERGVAHSPAQ